MAKIQASTVSADKLFTLDGLDYPKGMYGIVYSNVQKDENGQIDETLIEVGINSGTGVSSQAFVTPQKISSWKNGSDVAYTTLDGLLTDLVTHLGFNTGGSSSLTPSLTQVLGVGDVESNLVGIATDSILTIDGDWAIKETYIDTSSIGTGSLFLDNSIMFPTNATLRFQAGFAADDDSEVTLLPFPFNTDAVVYYQGQLITSITVDPTDYCLLKHEGSGIWILTIPGKGTGDMVTGATFSGAFLLDRKGGRSYLPYTQTGSIVFSIASSPITGGFAVLRFTANGSSISGFSGWKLLSPDGITQTNGVVHRIVVYQYEDEIWYSVKLN